jgi:large subunit ribosomal protein L23
MDIIRIIKLPINTEKALAAQRDRSVYSFWVDRRASKGQIKSAIEEIFQVKVKKVRTAIFGGKLRRMGRYAGYRPDRKKAIVTLLPGQTIKTAEESV